MRIKLTKLPAILARCLLLAPICLTQAQERTKGKEPIATIAGQPVYEDELLPLAQSRLLPLHNQEFQIKKQALETLVNQKVLEAEAKKKGISTDKLLQQEVDSKVVEPTDVELNAVYLSQKDQLNRPFNEVKPQLQQSLKRAKLQQARQEYFAHLREQAKVSILLQPPRVEVGYDPARVRGNPKARVVIIEFSDFQCPFCREVQPTLRNLLRKHDGQIGLAYRDLPLKDIHPQAPLAAEAGRCAGEQGKFWEYHDLLFANPNKLDRPGLLEQARSLKLDEKQFDSCIAAEKYKAQIQEDIQDGLRAGVSGTPGFFINGVYLNGAQPETVFEQTIQEALSAAQNKPSSQ